MLESDYKPIIEAYLSNHSTVDSFITDFMHQWKVDRDGGSRYNGARNYYKLQNAVYQHNLLVPQKTSVLRGAE